LHVRGTGTVHFSEVDAYEREREDLCVMSNTFLPKEGGSMPNILRWGIVNEVGEDDLVYQRLLHCRSVPTLLAMLRYSKDEHYLWEVNTWHKSSSPKMRHRFLAWQGFGD
jgi:hypothetical protein